MISRRTFLKTSLMGCLGLLSLSGSGCKLTNFFDNPRVNNQNLANIDNIDRNDYNSWARLNCGPDTWYWRRENDFYFTKAHSQNSFSEWPLSSKITYADVAIIGAGPAGLVCANHLLNLGVDKIVLLDSCNVPGGSAKSFNPAQGRSYSGYLSQDIPWAAGRLSLPDDNDENLINFLQAQKIIEKFDAAGRAQYASEALAFYPQERLLNAGRWFFGNYDGTDTLQQDAKDQHLSAENFDNFLEHMEHKRGRDGKLYFTAPESLVSAEAQALGRLTLKEYLQQKHLLTKDIEQFIDRIVCSESGLTTSQISAWAGLYQLCRDKTRLTRPQRLFLTWEKGCAKLLEPLYKNLQPLIKTSTHVVSWQEGNHNSELLCLNLKEKQRERLIAKEVVFASSAANLAKLLNLQLKDQLTFWNATAFQTKLEPLTYNQKFLNAPPAFISRLNNHPSIIYTDCRCQRESSLPHQRTILLRRCPEKLEANRLADYFAQINTETAPFIDNFAEQSHEFWTGNFGPFLAALPGKSQAKFSLNKKAKCFNRLHLALTDLCACPNFAQSFDNGWQAAEKVSLALRQRP